MGREGTPGPGAAAGPLAAGYLAHNEWRSGRGASSGPPPISWGLHPAIGELQMRKGFLKIFYKF